MQFSCSQPCVRYGALLLTMHFWTLTWFLLFPTIDLYFKHLIFPVLFYLLHICFLQLSMKVFLWILTRDNRLISGRVPWNCSIFMWARCELIFTAICHRLRVFRLHRFWRCPTRWRQGVDKLDCISCVLLYSHSQNLKNRKTMCF